MRQIDCRPTKSWSIVASRLVKSRDTASFSAIKAHTKRNSILQHNGINIYQLTFLFRKYRMCAFSGRRAKSAGLKGQRTPLIHLHEYLLLLNLCSFNVLHSLRRHVYILDRHCCFPMEAFLSPMLDDTFYTRHRNAFRTIRRLRRDAPFPRIDHPCFGSS